MNTEGAVPQDAERKAAILKAALIQAPFDGFTDALLENAAKDAGVDALACARLFPDGAASLVGEYSHTLDRAMEEALGETDFSAMRVRDRIAKAILLRLSLMRPDKEAARRAAAFLAMPPHAPLLAKLLWQTADLMWRATGDTATDFNFYTKRAILIGVYSATLVRWFNDQSAGECDTHTFLDHRIEDVMRFEKFKAQMKKEAARMPSLTEFLNGFNRRPPSA